MVIKLRKVGDEKTNKNGVDKKHPVIINGKIFTQKITGVQRYGIELIKQIDRIVNPGEVILALPNKNLNILPELSNIKTVVVGKRTGNKWTQIDLPLFALKKGGRILTFAGIAPIIKPDYLVAHDISFIRYPRSYGKRFRRSYRLGYYLTLPRCKKIITVSEFSKRELMSYYKLDESRITVVSNSANHICKEECSTEYSLEKWGISEGERFCLSVGTKGLHKNQIYIRKLANKYPDMKFVIAGGKNRSVLNENESGDKEDFGILRDLCGASAVPNLIQTGYVTEEELRALYQKAYAFIFPSLYEGFGIPPMEAIMSGVKRIAVSDIPVMREIYSKGCYFFNPTDIASFDMEALEKSAEGYKENEIRDYYRKEYSWEKSAQHLLEEIR
ncbi:glycosyltransferase family 4 protein [Butyrivibrio sp. AE3004]|uniref:glycosyltransferase family 4 protein n=1 Tax=Butyrivibrio sp. AE3004 TaxID=1506994 RepID=UPI000493BBAB|nr:glycosyltransferase family 1 protein [Butyrivibrio sp. AE3004]